MFQYDVRTNAPSRTAETTARTAFPYNRHVTPTFHSHRVASPSASSTIEASLTLLARSHGFTETVNSEML